MDRRLLGPQSRSGHGAEEKNSQPPPGFEPRSTDRPARRQCAHTHARAKMTRNKIKQGIYNISIDNKLFRVFKNLSIYEQH